MAIAERKLLLQIGEMVKKATNPQMTALQGMTGQPMLTQSYNPPLYVPVSFPPMQQQGGNVTGK